MASPAPREGEPQSGLADARRSVSRSISEILVNGLEEVSAVADASLLRMSAIAGLGLHGAYETSSISDEEVEDDESFVFLDPTAHLDEVSTDEEAEALLSQRVSRLKARLRSLKEQLRQPLPPQRILLRDKLTFMLGVVMCMLSAYWLGFSPATFYKVYTVETAVLFAARFLMYRRKKWHYFMLDFCYWANVLLLVHLWFIPHSAVLHKITFAYASGPLACSVIAFNNSLVFHSLDKFTSLFVHWFPAVIVWAERWHHPAQRGTPLRAKADKLPADWNDATFLELFFYPMLVYLIWAGLYYAKIFVFSARKIQERGYQTLFKYMTSHGGPVAKLILSCPRHLQPAAYMGLHLTLSGVACAASLLWWHSRSAHTAFLLAVLAISAWNGATYYFDYFALRYRAMVGLDGATRARSAVEDKAD